MVQEPSTEEEEEEEAEEQMRWYTSYSSAQVEEAAVLLICYLHALLEVEELVILGEAPDTRFVFAR